MEILTTIAQCRDHRLSDRAAGRRVALVPTMGFLHEGHLELVRRAREVADSVWVSIFVNPTQFGPHEDFESYPRELKKDAELLAHEGVDIVFAPTTEEIYPRDPIVQIGFSGLERKLCGTDRPTHFAGVGLVVSQLFNVIQPDRGIFGQKDAQQVLLIRRLANELHFPVEIIVVPTVRESDGLAMSSRNAYLTPQERTAASTIYATVCKARDAIEAGEVCGEAVRRILITGIRSEELLELQYAECVDVETLERTEMISGSVLLAVAVRVGKSRLIDNVTVTPSATAEGTT
ncbi:MAG: pantoate--beta-alanine ligase [bacterium]|nr:pantoate--beta-alanine ligase [bacterium]